MRLVIFGIGGFGREVAFAARDYTTREGRQLVFADDRRSDDVLGTTVIGVDEIAGDDDLILAVGSPQARRTVADRLAAFKCQTIIAPTALIGPDVTIGEGAILCDHAMITASARIGLQFQCNIYSYVAHDCVVGDFVTFAPRVCCNGNVHIEDDCYIGTGAVLRQGTVDKPLTIGRGAVVGMGAVVTKDVPPGVTVVGNPARPLER